MKFVKRSRKFFSILFLLITLESIVQPTITYALTTGPHQPEYTSYEQPGATDMVNMLTGDFTFSLPIFEVPGPDGNFSVPLTYNAGIGPEQEASWVGLGWTLNIGAITREINQYPDDASSEVQSVHNVNLAGVRGWSSAALGLGQIGWNTLQGSYGSISLLGVINFSYDNKGVTSGGIMGVNLSGGNVDFDMAQFGMGAMTIASLGVAGLSAETGAYALSGTLKEAASQLMVSAAVSSVASAQTPQISPSAGYWAYNKKHEEQGFLHKDYWIWLDQTRNEQMFGILNLDKAPMSSSALMNYYARTGDYPNYNYYLPSSLDYTSINNNNYYSPISAYFYDINNTGAASDINYYIPAGTQYKDAQSPSILAEDNFSVKAPGISGSIKPYRLDVGSVSMPRAMTQYHVRYNPIPFSKYKVPFKYEGILSSSYLYHTGNSNPTFNFGLSNVMTYVNPLYYYADGYPRADTDYPAASVDCLYMNISDAIFGTQRVRQDVKSNNYKIPVSNHIEWLSNSEIASSSTGFSNGFMDYFTSSSTPTRDQFRQTYSFGGNFSYYAYSSATGFKSSGKINLLHAETKKFQVNQNVTLNTTVYGSSSQMTSLTNGTILTPQNSVVTAVDTVNNQITLSVPSSLNQYSGNSYFSFQIVTSTSPKATSAIGGFSITGVNGLTYHFALPIYDYQFSSWIGDINNPNTYNTTISRDAPFANTWLLTGVTGPDFVDRNSNGAIDENDWGYWVKFNYSKYQDSFSWRVPYAANSSTPNPENTSKGYSQGLKQLFYLNSIETRSHVALFIKDYRNDNKDATLANGNLRLSEIALLTRDNYKKLFSTYGQQNDSGTINSSWMSSIIFTSNPSLGAFIVQNASKRIKFNHTYDLCHATPNSVDVGKGKLTLTRVSIIGRNGTQLVPDYKFDYGNTNPSYDANKWDGWGMYNSTGTTAYNTHAASSNDLDGAAWSMSQITTPQGSTINVTYERDTYSSISGTPVSALTYSLNTLTTYNVPSYGSTTLTIPSYTGGLNPGDKVNIDGTMSYSCNGTSLTDEIHNSCYVSSINGTTITFSTPFGISSRCPGNGPTNISYSGTISSVFRNIRGEGLEFHQ